MRNPTASIIIIGNEILSGRTLDVNTQEIAQTLGKKGIIVAETRTIPDIKEMIITHVRELSEKYDYVFTTGGIGPTHDDITAESIAAAFDLPYSRNEEIYQIIKNYYDSIGEKLNPAREKMAYIPEGADLIFNKATMIPGFITRNVYTMAGIPDIMKAMLESTLPKLKNGNVVKSKTIDIMLGESKIADQFSDLQKKYPNIDMGSYPFTKDGQHGTSLVLRSSDYLELDAAYAELQIICGRSA
ncbi:MAG: competence/damage-inducible protein A [Pseudomonadota bacterium]